MNEQWRQSLPVLVTEAQAMGSLAVIRSLGRAGYPVHAVASQGSAIGLQSAYPVARVVCPAAADLEFVPWLRDYVRTHGIRAIVPSEGAWLAIRPHFDELSPLLPSHDDPNVVYGAMSKFDTLCSFVAAGITSNLPPTLFVELDRPLPAASDVESLGLPVFIKVDACHSFAGRRSKVIKAGSAGEAVQVLESLQRHYRKALVQGYVPGMGVGAFFLRWKGSIVAEFMHRRLHEVPHTGGISSFRESWFDADVRGDALRRLEHLDWEGVGMMEYRWDPVSHRFYLMELNARFWGSLHLALFAGIDFPRLLLDAFFGRPDATVREYAVGVRCRQTFPREIHHVWSVLKDAQVANRRKAGAVLRFLLHSLDPRIYSDMSFPGDRRLQWLSIERFVFDELVKPVRQRLRRSQ